MKLETESIMPKSCIVAAGLGLELCYLASCSKLHKNIYQWLAKKKHISKHAILVIWGPNKKIHIHINKLNTFI